MIYIKAGMCSKFGEIRPWTTELAALERLKKIPWTSKFGGGGVRRGGGQVGGSGWWGGSGWM